MADRNQNPFLEAQRPRPTGNVLVAFKPQVSPDSVADFFKSTGITVRSSGTLAGASAVAYPQVDFGAALVTGPPTISAHVAAISEGHAFVFEGLNIAVVPSRQGVAASAMATALEQDDRVLQARPEFYMFAIGDGDRYENWVREGLHLLINSPALSASAPMRTLDTGALTQRWLDTAESTWGIKAVGADRSQFTGRGVKLAVLDTGFDLGFSFPTVPGEQFDPGRRHPDFLGRTFACRNFVDGALDAIVSDHFGHGTHCLGTAAGPKIGPTHPRYGIATEVDLYVGKVLGDQGSGGERDIIAGIEWALTEKCAVISISIGRPVQLGEEPDPLYEQIGQAALDAGCLIVAAAGNDSYRSSGYIAPISAPANSTTILAVSAVDGDMKVAPFSNGGVNSGGEIALAAPGMTVFSSFPRPQLYKTLMGTSMATPHVAGVAALWAQSDLKLRGKALWRALTSSAIELGLPLRDVGSGLVQAPQTPAPPTV